MKRYFARRRHVQELRKAYKHALESDKLKTAFIRNVSHEVRTPLNIISGFAQVLSNPDLDISVGERQQLASDMTKNARLITRLVDEMLGLSLSETTNKQLELGSVKVNQTIKQVLADAKDDVHGNTEIRFETTLPDDFTLQTHQDMLRRIIASLVDNSLKNTAEGSVTLKTTANDEMLSIIVEDTGCGIPPSEAEHIFERFVKLDTFKVGLGLGLTLCRTMTNRLGGNVVLDTAYAGPGSRFIVTLPLSQPANENISKTKL